MAYKLKATKKEIISENGVQKTLDLKVVCKKDGRNAKFERKIPVEEMGLPLPISEADANKWVRNYMTVKRSSRVDDLKAEVDALLVKAPEPVITVEKFDSADL